MNSASSHFLAGLRPASSHLAWMYLLMRAEPESLVVVSASCAYPVASRPIAATMIRIVRIVPSDKSRVLPLNKEVPRKVAAKNEYGMPRRGGTLEGVSVFLVLLLICQESPDQLV